MFSFFKTPKNNTSKNDDHKNSGFSSNILIKYHNKCKEMSCEDKIDQKLKSNNCSIKTIFLEEQAQKLETANKDLMHKLEEMTCQIEQQKQLLIVQDQQHQKDLQIIVENHQNIFVQLEKELEIYKMGNLGKVASELKEVKQQNEELNQRLKTEGDLSSQEKSVDSLQMKDTQINAELENKLKQLQRDIEEKTKKIEKQQRKIQTTKEEITQLKHKNFQLEQFINLNFQQSIDKIKTNYDIKHEQNSEQQGMKNYYEEITKKYKKGLKALEQSNSMEKIQLENLQKFIIQEGSEINKILFDKLIEQLNEKIILKQHYSKKLSNLTENVEQISKISRSNSVVEQNYCQKVENDTRITKSKNIKVNRFSKQNKNSKEELSEPEDSSNVTKFSSYQIILLNLLKYNTPQDFESLILNLEQIKSKYNVSSIFSQDTADTQQRNISQPSVGDFNPIIPLSKKVTRVESQIQNETVQINQNSSKENSPTTNEFYLDIQACTERKPSAESNNQSSEKRKSSSSANLSSNKRNTVSYDIQQFNSMDKNSQEILKHKKSNEYEFIEENLPCFQIQQEQDCNSHITIESNRVNSLSNNEKSSNLDEIPKVNLYPQARQTLNIDPSLQSQQFQLNQEDLEFETRQKNKSFNQISQAQAFRWSHMHHLNQTYLVLDSKKLEQMHQLQQTNQNNNQQKGPVKKKKFWNKVFHWISPKKKTPKGNKKQQQKASKKQNQQRNSLLYEEPASPLTPTSGNNSFTHLQKSNSFLSKRYSQEFNIPQNIHSSSIINISNIEIENKDLQYLFNKYDNKLKEQLSNYLSISNCMKEFRSGKRCLIELKQSSCELDLYSEFSILQKKIQNFTSKYTTEFEINYFANLNEKLHKEFITSYTNELKTTLLKTQKRKQIYNFLDNLQEIQMPEPDHQVSTIYDPNILLKEFLKYQCFLKQNQDLFHAFIKILKNHFSLCHEISTLGLLSINHIINWLSQQDFNLKGTSTKAKIKDLSQQCLIFFENNYPKKQKPYFLVEEKNYQKIKELQSSQQKIQINSYQKYKYENSIISVMLQNDYQNFVDIYKIQKNQKKKALKQLQWNFIKKKQDTAEEKLKAFNQIYKKIHQDILQYKKSITPKIKETTNKFLQMILENYVNTKNIDILAFEKINKQFEELEKLLILNINFIPQQKINSQQKTCLHFTLLVLINQIFQQFSEKYYSEFQNSQEQIGQINKNNSSFEKIISQNRFALSNQPILVFHEFNDL